MTIQPKKFTPSQRVVLLTLYDVAANENRPIILKNRFHSTAWSLANRGLVHKIDRGFYRPLYELTQAGLDLCKTLFPAI